jgi:hypothetical protein
VDNKETTKHILFLRIFLLAGVVGWGISLFGVFMPWAAVVGQLEGLGAQNIGNDPMLNYWLRMTSAAFSFIGILFLLCAINPRKYAVLVPWLGGFMIIEGLVLLFYGLWLSLSLLPFVVDASFCLVIGAGIIAAQNKLKNSGGKGPANGG